jgi:hypothetical protein
VAYTKKVRLWSKLHALELLGKHLRLFTDVIRHEEDLRDRIKEARKRVQGISS